MESQFIKLSLFVMLCAICYHQYNLKNVKNIHERVLPLVKFQTLACNFTKSNTPPWLITTTLLKSTLLHGRFLRFLHCANGTKSHIAPNLDLIGVQTGKIFLLTYVGRVFENLKKKIQSFQGIKIFQRFRVLLLVKFQTLACNFTKSNTPPWLITTTLLKSTLLHGRFLRFLHCANGTKSHIAPNLDLIGVQTGKIFLLTYVGRVFENLKKKIQSFQGIKIFRRFRVFVLS